MSPSRALATPPPPPNPATLFLPPAAGIVASDLSQRASPLLRASLWLPGFTHTLLLPLSYLDSCASFKAQVTGSFLLSSLGLSGFLKPHVSLVV